MTKVPTNAELHAELADASKTLLRAKSSFNRAWIRFWHSVEPCSDELGFALLEGFRQHAWHFVMEYKRKERGVKHAANELFRLVAVERATYTFEQLRSFIKWYEKLKSRIGRAIAPLFDYHGDGFGDLCDSLPLAGEKIVRRLLATDAKSGRPRREGFLEEGEIFEAIKQELHPGWAKFIQGENYVLSALEEQACKWWLREVLDEIPQEEYASIDLATHWDD